MVKLPNGDRRERDHGPAAATLQLLRSVEPNRTTLETFLRHHHAQGLSSRLVKVEELFHPSTHETFKL